MRSRPLSETVSKTVSKTVNWLNLSLITIGAAASALVFTSRTSFAADPDAEYGVAGCGLGSMVMGKEGNQILAITTNETGIQTFGITTGSSNCVDSGVVKKKRRARAFIETNQMQLANDISKGGGETVTSLSHIYNCQDDQALGHALQHHYQTIFPHAVTTPDHVEAAIRAVIMVEFTNACLT